MKTYKIDYEMAGTVTDVCRAWVRANSEEEAIQYLENWNWEHIEENETLDAQYNDDYDIVEVTDVMEEYDN